PPLISRYRYGKEWKSPGERTRDSAVFKRPLNTSCRTLPARLRSLTLQATIVFTCVITRINILTRSASSSPGRMWKAHAGLTILRRHEVSTAALSNLPMTRVRTQAAVSTAFPHATEAASSILRQGGNAIDAAV